MAGATIWKGYIHFGEIDVAVKLHSAVKEERIRFHLLHKHDQARLRQQMVCAYEKKPVPPEEQSRGFEVEEGKYIIVGPGELEKTSPEDSRMIEVHEFVKRPQVDPFFLDRVYYLEPDIPDLNSKGYSALAVALNELDVEGICTWTMRKRSYVGALQAGGHVLRLSTLRYADEVVAAAALQLRSVSLPEKELELGSMLINKLAAPFKPGKFANEHEKKLQVLIDRKARGETIAVLKPKRVQPTEPGRLLEALEASLKRAA